MLPNLNIQTGVARADEYDARAATTEGSGDLNAARALIAPAALAATLRAGGSVLRSREHLDLPPLAK
jgi:hypothetical protein